MSSPLSAWVLLAAAAYLAFEAARGLRSGRTISLFMFVRRAEHPVWFRALTASSFLLAIGAFVIATEILVG